MSAIDTRALEIRGVRVRDYDGEQWISVEDLQDGDYHVVRDEAATDGHDHVVMFVDSDARDALRARLFEPDMRGVGYSAFITQAVERSRS